jgi:hypothetical protein
MADARVTCINKQPRDDTHHGITHLGGSNWKWPRQDVIKSIKEGTNTFHTLVNGNRAEIKVRQGPNGEYVQTQADGVWSDNLLALPECG